MCGGGGFSYSCGSGGCGACANWGARDDNIYMLPTKIDLENKVIKFKFWSNDREMNEKSLSFKQARKYQKGDKDTDNTTYIVCGVKINKDGELAFTKKGKDHIKEFSENGDKAWKKFKKLKAEIKEELETLKEQDTEEEEDLEM